MRGSELLAMQIPGYVELWASAKSYTDVFYVLQKEIAARLQQMFVESLEYMQVCDWEARICESR